MWNDRTGRTKTKKQKQNKYTISALIICWCLAFKTCTLNSDEKLILPIAFCVWGTFLREINNNYALIVAIAYFVLNITVGVSASCVQFPSHSQLKKSSVCERAHVHLIDCVCVCVCLKVRKRERYSVEVELTKKHWIKTASDIFDNDLSVTLSLEASGLIGWRFWLCGYSQTWQLSMEQVFKKAFG